MPAGRSVPRPSGSPSAKNLGTKALGALKGVQKRAVRGTKKASRAGVNAVNRRKSDKPDDKNDTPDEPKDEGSDAHVGQEE